VNFGDVPTPALFPSARSSSFLGTNCVMHAVHMINPVQLMLQMALELFFSLNHPPPGRRWCISPFASPVTEVRGVDPAHRVCWLQLFLLFSNFSFSFWVGACLRDSESPFLNLPSPLPSSRVTAPRFLHPWTKRRYLSLMFFRDSFCVFSVC